MLASKGQSTVNQVYRLCDFSDMIHSESFPLVFFQGQQDGVSQANRNLFGFSNHLSKDDLHLLVGAPMFQQQTGFVQILSRDNAEETSFKPYMENPNMYVFLCFDLINDCEVILLIV